MTDETTQTPESPEAPEAREEAPERPERTFTQEDLDRHVKERLARERKKYEGFDDLKRKAEQFDAIQDEQKTEIERAQEAQRQAEERAQSSTEAAQKNLRRAAVISEAAQHNAANPKLIARLLADDDSISVDDNGEVQGAEEAVKSLLEQESYLRRNDEPTSKRPSRTDDGGPRNPGKSTLTVEQVRDMSPEQINARWEEVEKALNSSS